MRKAGTLLGTLALLAACSTPAAPSKAAAFASDETRDASTRQLDGKICRFLKLTALQAAFPGEWRDVPMRNPDKDCHTVSPATATLSVRVTAAAVVNENGRQARTHIRDRYTETVGNGKKAEPVSGVDFPAFITSLPGDTVATGDPATQRVQYLVQGQIENLTIQMRVTLFGPQPMADGDFKKEALAVYADTARAIVTG
ncbi:hypothetical protein [Longispora albida]|uniref:hypothetical protein n=1 Tax=Longispora albida TaxID=203523 RepID=UPI00035E3F8B|nr:hypothetical protein [Longispora albida]